MIDNTSENMKDPAHSLLFFAASLAPGGSDRAIEEQERAGQTQLVSSDRLPTQLNAGTDADFEALGFVFGEPDPADPLFRPAQVPDGWTKEGADHDMGSYVVDQHGRRRVTVFYKAAFYDRRAHMTLHSIHWYVTSCVRQDTPIVTDDTWATPATVAAALRTAAAHAKKDADDWRGHAERAGGPEYAAKRATEYAAAHVKYAALAATYEAQR
jgi:hypothetical protein